MNKIPLKKVGKATASDEIMSCQNKNFSCSLPVENGFKFCIKHILQDPKATYKPCNFIFSGNGKQCGQAKLASLEECNDKK